MAQKKSKQPSDEELLKLGKKLQQFYNSGYVDKKSTIWFSFLKGLAGGFGAFLGGTILIALLLWFLGFFDQLTLVDHFVKIIESAINSN